MASKYKPILFSTEMVKAILEGRKTQTRRICKIQPENGYEEQVYASLEYDHESKDGPFLNLIYRDKKTNSLSYYADQGSLPIAQVGNILWVRESFCKISENNFEYKTGFTDEPIKWKPSIHMPKEAARIFLEVTNVRVERLRDISEDDAIAEGIERVSIAPFVHRFKNYLCNNKFIGPKESFKTLWMKINGIDSWKANPWVWVYEFKVVEKPNDFLITNI